MSWWMEVLRVPIFICQPHSSKSSQRGQPLVSSVFTGSNLNPLAPSYAEKLTTTPTRDQTRWNHTTGIISSLVLPKWEDTSEPVRMEAVKQSVRRVLIGMEESLVLGQGMPISYYLAYDKPLSKCHDQLRVTAKGWPVSSDLVTYSEIHRRYYPHNEKLKAIGSFYLLFELPYRERLPKPLFGLPSSSYATWPHPRAV